MFPQPHQLVRSSIYISTYLHIYKYLHTARSPAPESFHPRILSPRLGRGRTVRGAAQLLGSPVTPHLHLSSVSQLQLHCSEAHCVRTSARLCGCRHGQQNIFNCFFMSLFEECYKIEIS